MYLGLDCSTLAVHGVLLDKNENILKFYKWGSKKKTFEERFPEILLDFFEDLSKIKILNASVEAAVYVQNHRIAIKLSYVVGAVWLSLLKAGINTEIIENKEWKKGVLDKGNASKIEIKNFAIEKWGDVFPEQDYADAACIALLTKRRS
jgi:Holliday junction resolvasome RuvABC endonuclease subunit